MCYNSSFKQAYILNLGSEEPFFHMAEKQIILKTVEVFYLKRKYEK